MLVMLLNLPNMSPKDAAPDLNWSSILIPSNISIQVWFQDRDFINLLQSPEEFRVAGIDVTVPKTAPRVPQGYRNQNVLVLFCL